MSQLPAVRVMHSPYYVATDPFKYRHVLVAPIDSSVMDIPAT